MAVTFLTDVDKRELNDKIDGVAKELGGKPITIKTPIDLEFTKNKTVGSDGTVREANNYYGVSRYIDVIEGEQYEIHGRNNWGNCIYAFYDDSENVVGKMTTAGSTVGTLCDEIVTVPEGATKLIVSFTVETLYFVNKVTTEYREESCKVAFPLHNKKVLSFGDSLAEGGANGGVSYAHLIAQNNKMQLFSEALGGATMRVVSGSNNNVCKQVDHAIEYNSTKASVTFDFVLLEGGTNDVNAGTLGDIIDGYDVSTCDNTTFTGALEINISKIRNAWWGANIIYILAHKMSSRNTEKQKQFHDRIIEVCNKWGIPYVDIYNNGQIMSNVEVLLNNCFADATHPNGTGYEKFYVPPITAKKKELV